MFVVFELMAREALGRAAELDPALCRETRRCSVGSKLAGSDHTHAVVESDVDTRLTDGSMYCTGRRPT